MDSPTENKDTRILFPEKPLAPDSMRSNKLQHLPFIKFHMKLENIKSLTHLLKSLFFKLRLS